MKVAVLGASGFIGYNFYRYAVEQGITDIVAYCSSATKLTNLARHDVDLRFVPYARLPEESLDSDVDFLVNFSHPFAKREELSVEEQSDRLVDFVLRSVKTNAALKVVHVSTLSVYEPFAHDHYYPEHKAISPPKSDKYASSKARIEEKLLKHEEMKSSIVTLRPTMVFGPFGGPWTDSIFQNFRAGDVAYENLDGRFQPVYVDDLVRFIHKMLLNFVPGTFNFGGPEVLSWHEFLSFFEEIAGVGRLIGPERRELSSEDPIKSESMGRRWTSALIGKVDSLLSGGVRERVVRSSPPELLQYARRKLGRPIAGEAGHGVVSPYQRSFFSEDRLVSMQYFNRTFEEFSFTRLEETANRMKQYYSYRFVD